ncbi:MAG: DUF3696 domain-containing protein [bacterium]|nr:DUF3696 domain-containing protein [bacterium]MDE0668816.1 DUF3696 domain-containing protein [bacterium]MXZ31700.1 DUF3696 domain-containing protein [Acidimicrobiia bacterium]
MFTSMRTLNFKGWQDTGHIDLRPITGFFGANSSGKTSLLQLLLLLKQTVASADRRQVLDLGGDRNALIALGLIKDIFFNQASDRTMSLRFEWHLNGRKLSPADPTRPNQDLFSSDWMSFQSDIALRGEHPYVKRLEYAADNAHVEMTSSTTRGSRVDPEYKLEARINGDSEFLARRGRGRAWHLPPPAKCYGFPDEVSAYFRNADFVSELELELERQFGNRLFYLGPLRNYPERQYTWQGSRPSDVGRSGERAVDALLASRLRGRTNTRKLDKRGRAIRRITLEEHVAGWLQDLELISTLKIERISQDADIYRVRVTRAQDLTPVLLTDVGFGVSQILPVLVLLAYVDEGSTVLLEQPEIHLHPAVQASLADVIVEVATVRKVQVIIESHSEHLLRRLQRRVSEQDLNPDDVALYFCENTGEGSEIKSLELDQFGEIANWPPGFFGDPFGETAAIVEAGLLQRTHSPA